MLCVCISNVLLIEYLHAVNLSFFKGIYEALELRDGGSDYLGKGVLKVRNASCLCFPIKWRIKLFSNINFTNVKSNTKELLFERNIIHEICNHRKLHLKKKENCIRCGFSKLCILLIPNDPTFCQRLYHPTGTVALLYMHTCLANIKKDF